MGWDDDRVREVADAYRRHFLLSTGDHAQRAEADDLQWAWDAVTDAAMDGSLPLESIDAMLHHPEADEPFRFYVAAGPIEDLLTNHPAAYGTAIATRCDLDPRWAAALAGVWLSESARSALPPGLRRRFDGGVRGNPRRRGARA